MSQRGIEPLIRPMSELNERDPLLLQSIELEEVSDMKVKFRVTPKKCDWPGCEKVATVSRLTNNNNKTIFRCDDHYQM